MPIRAHQVHGLAAGVGERVVLSNGTQRGFLQARLQETRTAQARQQGIDGAFRDDQGLDAGQVLHEFVGVHLAFRERGDDAEFEQAFAGLGDPVAEVEGLRSFVHGYTVLELILIQTTLLCKTNLETG